MLLEAAHSIRCARDIFQPSSNKRQLLGINEYHIDKFSITRDHIVGDGLRASLQAQLPQFVNYPTVVQIARYFIPEIMQQVVIVALLPDRAAMKKNMPSAFPSDSLGDERAPDVGHSETAKGRQIQQRKGILEPSGVLAVEGADAVSAQCHVCGGIEVNRQRQGQAVKGIDIGILISQSLLNRTVGDNRIRKRRHVLSNMIEGETSRPNMAVGEVTIDVHPAAADQRVS